MNLDIFVIADKESCLGQLEDVLDVADWADHLASSHVLIVPLRRDRRPLDLLGDAVFTKGISTVEDTRLVGLTKSSVAEHAVSQVAPD